MSDPLEKYFPEFKNHQIFDKNGKLHIAKNKITIQTLLNMTSGIPYPWTTTFGGSRMAELEDGLRVKLTKEDMTTEEITRMYSLIPGNFEPGTKWEYG